MPNLYSRFHTLGIYPPAYCIIVKSRLSVSSQCLDDMGSFLTSSTAAIPLFRCFSASSEVWSIAIILKVRNEPPGRAECSCDLGEGTRIDNQLIGGFLSGLIWRLGLVLWIVLMIKAYQGTRYKLPWSGNLAEKRVGQ